MSLPRGDGPVHAAARRAAPAAVNTAQLLAPQDTFTAPANQAGLAFKADVELTREDHRRLRRSRKADNRADRKRHDLHEYRLGPGGGLPRRCPPGLGRDWLGLATGGPFGHRGSSTAFSI